jgi:hypothetical protein
MSVPPRLPLLLWPMRGNSMAPALLDGDTLYLTPAPGGVFVGEVALVLVDRGFVVHRVEEASPTRLRTRGDANIQADPPVDPSRVFYRVAAVGRGGRVVAVPDARPGWRLRLRRWRGGAAVP